MSAVGAYLAKKNWNPGNKKNVEEVWKKEQQKKDEDKKVQELRREYEEERNREQLDELQVKAGVKKSSTRLEWMYDGPPVDNNNNNQKAHEAAATAAAAAKDSEAYLLGEKSIAPLLQHKKVDVSRHAPLSMADSSSSSSSSSARPAFSANEQMLRMHEDPLAHIQLQSEANRQKRDLKDKLEEKRNHKLIKKKDKKKDKKKERKHSKRRRTSSSSSSDSSDDDDEEKEDKKKRKKQRKD